MTPMRLQKYLAHAGVCSRRHAEGLIARGKVSVNGQVITQMGVSVDPAKDRITVSGKKVELQVKYTYIMLNKPAGYITSCSHPGKKIVLDLVKLPQRLYPVGRLDKDSTGLLLLTDDGKLHHRLSHPSFDHEKEYMVEVAKEISSSALDTLRKGIILDGAKTRSAKVKRLGPKSFMIILKQGKKRQIRRMVQKTHNRVTLIHRIRVSQIRLSDLPSGQWRHLKEDEKKQLLKGMDKP